MKKTNLLRLLAVPALGVAIVGGLLFTNSNSNESVILPEPVDPGLFGENDEVKERRKEYNNILHGGIADWRERDLEFRKQKALKNSMSRSASSSAYANGALEGNWSETGSANYSGRIRSVFYDKSDGSVYAGSEGGVIWKSDINGTNWTPLNDNFNMYSPMYITRGIQGAGNRLFVISDAGPLYSDNEGGTWAEPVFVPEVHQPAVEDFAVRVNDVTKTMFILAGQKASFHTSIYTSVDNGKTFNIIYDFQEAKGVTVSLWADENSSTAYCLVGNKVNTVSASGGLTEIGTLPYVDSQGGSVELLGKVHQGVTYLYAIHEKFIYRSDDVGLTWDLEGEFPSGVAKFSKRSLDVSAGNPDILYMGSIDGYKSVDKGASWTRINRWQDYYNDFDKLHADIPHVLSLLDNSGDEITFFATDGGLYKTTDFATTFTNISKQGLHSSQYYSCETFGPNESVIYAGSQDQGGQQSLTDNGSVRDFDQFVSGDNGIAVSSDGGQSVWQTGYSYVFYLGDGLNSPNTNAWGSYNGINNQLFIPQLMEEPNDPQVAYLAGGNESGDATGRIFKFEYTGQAITREALPYVFDSRVYDLTYSKVNTDIRYASTASRKLYRSDDAGVTWNEVNSSLSVIANQVITSSINESEVIICGSNYLGNNVFRSLDGGVTFSSISLGIPSTLVNDIDFNADETLIFAATEVGPYVYVVADNRWYDLSQGNAPDQRYTSVEYLPVTKKVRYATYGRGVFDFNITAENAGGDDVVVTIEAETFINTGGTINDAAWGGPGLGVNNSGSAINWVNGGDWAEYSITVAEAGAYDIEYLISTPNNNTNVNFYLNDALISSDAVVNNGQWDAFQALAASNTVELVAGTHTVKIEATGGTWQWNLDKITLTKPKTIIDPIAPVVTFVQPTNGEVIVDQVPYDVHVVVDASDEDGTIESVTLLYYGNLVSTDTEAPFEWNSATDDEPILDNLPVGTYQLTAIATDNDGLQTQENITFTIEKAQIPPVVTFTQPTAGEVITSSGDYDLDVTADISDSDGYITEALFYLNDEFIGTDYDAPYQWNYASTFDPRLSDLSAGTYTLRIVAIDDEGLSTEEEITFTVQDQSVVINPIVIEAETFISTTGTINDAPWGGPGLGVNNSGTAINWVNSGDTAEYTFNVLSATTYEIEYLISSPNNNAQIEFYVDNVLISRDNVVNNGSWDSYISLVAANTVTLTAGAHTARIVASGSNTWQWNLDKITLSEYTSTPISASIAPSILALELYPNPAVEYLSVGVEGVLNLGAALEVMNSNGTVVIREQLVYSGQQIYIGNLQSGLYILAVDNGGIVSSQKFIKK